MSDDGGVFQGSVPENYRRHLEPVIFAPWAATLIDFAGVSAGDRLLDAAAGTGVVARMAAKRVGTGGGGSGTGGGGGRVVASDISAGMLAHVNADIDLDAAPIETAECSATALTFDDGTFDVVLCQQGFPFIPDREGAAREFRRVLRPGGKAAAAVWLSGADLHPFDLYGQVLEQHGAPEPFPGAFDPEVFKMTEDEMAAAFTAGGFHDIVVEVHEHTPPWASPQAAAEGITGTPFSLSLSTMGDDERTAFLDALADAFTGADGELRTIPQRAILARGTA